MALSVTLGLSGCGKTGPRIAFDHAVIDSEASGDCKAIGDVDADGKPDLIVAGKTFVWYHNPDWTKTVVARAIDEFTTDCQAVDINADGRVDVVTADGQDGDNVIWFENLGEQGWKRHSVGAHGTWVHDLEVADFDSDGRIDVLTHGHGTRIWYQNASGNWLGLGLDAPDTTAEGVGIGDVDSDGYVDVVEGGWWFKNPGRRAEPWLSSQFAAGYGTDGSYTAAVADLDRDGRPDIVVSQQHHRHELAWFSAPIDPRESGWRKHAVDYIGAHKLDVADINSDGFEDLIVGLELKELRVYVNDGATPPRFIGITVNSTGCHNTRVGDVDGDQRVDILCANFIEHPPIELWSNRSVAANGWQHIQIDTSRAKLSSGFPSFGLAFGDVDRDGLVDIVAGKYFYRNPGGQLTDEWERTTFPVDADGMLVLDVDGDGQLDVIAQSLPALYWLKPNADATQWTPIKVANLVPTEHRNGQGYRLARIVPDDAVPDIVMTTGDGVWVVRVPRDPSTSRESWPMKRIAANTTEDLLAVGDIDQDGFVDIVASDAATGREIRWYRNPGAWTEQWESHDVGEVTDWGDRCEIADIDHDGHLDIVVATENGQSDGAATYWFQAPSDATRQSWTRHTIAIQGSTNSLDVGDLDGSGEMAVVTGEHKGQLRVRIWTSPDRGQTWIDRVVDRGKESHLGARLIDLNGDGALDVVSTAWDAPSDLHVWRNDSLLRGPGADAEPDRQ